MTIVKNKHGSILITKSELTRLVSKYITEERKYFFPLQWQCCRHDPVDIQAGNSLMCNKKPCLSQKRYHKERLKFFLCNVYF